MKAGDQTELTLHRAQLDGEGVGQEPFLRAAEGSAFVPRAHELVLLSCTEGGLIDLPAKLEQLIDRGLHASIVSLAGVERLEDPPLARAALQRALAHSDKFLGWLCLCDLSDAVRGELGELDGLVLAGDEAAALQAYKGREAAPPSDMGAVEAGRLTSSLTESEDSWGWDSEAKQGEEAGLPRVEVAELFVEADELNELNEQVTQVLGRGKRYFTIRLHFPRGRRYQAEDVQALVAARDAVQAKGGQLALVALPQDFLQWLKLLDEERSFLILETSDDAERAHRQFAAGAGVSAADLTLTREGDRVTIKAAGDGPGQRLPARCLAVGPGTVPAVGARVVALAGEGVRDVVVDLSGIAGVDGLRLEPLAAAQSTARGEGVRLGFCLASPEVRALVELVGVEPRRIHASVDDALRAGAAELLREAPFGQLTFDLSKEQLQPLAAEEDPVAAVDFASEVGLVEPPGTQEELERLRRELAQARGEAERLRAQVTQAEAQAAAAREEARSREAAAAREERVSLEAQQAAQRVERKLEETTRQAEAAQAELSRLRQELEQGQSARAAAEARAGRLEQELAGLREAQASAGDSEEARVQALEQELNAAREARTAAEEYAKAIEQELAAARAAQGAALTGAEEEAKARAEALEAERAEAQQALVAAQERADALEIDLGAARAEAELASSQVEQLKERVAELEAGAADAERTRELEAEAAEAAQLRRRVAELEKVSGEALREVASLRARQTRQEQLSANEGGDAGLRARVAELEAEKARILAEADEEIERLSRDQVRLREELASAGEMIERLGTELELS